MNSVIIADDEIWIRTLIKRIIPWKELNLNLAGEAETGSKTLELCRQIRPSIVLLDIRMPGMDGIEIMRQLQEDAPNSRIIIVSGFDEFSYAKKALKYGASDYILKPIEEEELKDALISVLADINESENKRRRRRALYSENRRLFNTIAGSGKETSIVEFNLAATLPDRVVDIISRDLTVQRTLESVADELGVTHSYLSKIFKEQIGVGFSEYSTILRIKKAKNLLEFSTLQIHDIAALLGYADSHYFSRVFKCQVESNPSEYRERLLKP